MALGSEGNADVGRLAAKVEGLGARGRGCEGAIWVSGAALLDPSSAALKTASRTVSCTFFPTSSRIISFLRSALAAGATEGAEKMAIVVDRANARIC